MTSYGKRAGIVHDLLGEGGQGVVYRVECEGAELALKWYHPHVAASDVNLRARLNRAVHRGPPGDQFLWPLDIAEIEGRPSFGYLMGLREARFRCMSDLLARPPRRADPNLTTRLILCLRIAESFLKLHANGFCYQDVNFGNIFFDPDNGDARICDNDNVDVDGAPASVYGTRKFMAPEIVRREAMPSTRTDLYSLAVLFFYVLAGWHPLDGRREFEAQILDSSVEQDLYGRTPCFLFDPQDRRNGPVEGFHDGVVSRWDSLGDNLRNLFVQSFGPGLVDPHARVLETEWIKTLANGAVAVASCPRCGADHVFHAGADVETCPVCKAKLNVPPHMAIGRRSVVLQPGRLLPAFVFTQEPPNFDTIGGWVEAHPRKPGAFGLRNGCEEAWRVRYADGREVTAPPGKAVLLADGQEIRIGRRIGRVHWPAKGPVS